MYSLNHKKNINMNECYLNNALSIPQSHDTNDRSPARSDQRLLKLHQRHMTNRQANISVNSNQHHGVTEQNSRQRSTNSLSSISHATHATPTTPATHGSVHSTNQTSIAKVIDICNDIDTAENCIATESLVRKCIRNQIWITNKFLSDLSIKAMKIENRDNPNTVLNILINYTRKNELNDLERLKFWKKYSGMVQHDLNNIKTICTRSIKEEVMIGTYLQIYYL